MVGREDVDKALGESDILSRESYAEINSTANEAVNALPFEEQPTPSFEDAAIEALLLNRGNALMALDETWDKSDEGFESQVQTCDEALELAPQGKVDAAIARLVAEGIPPYSNEDEDDD